MTGTKPVLPMPADVYRTLTDALKTEEEEWGVNAETANARQWLKDLADFWPSLVDVPEGVDNKAISE
jgi:hypothetical protein